MDGSKVDRNGEQNEKIEAVINMYKWPLSPIKYFSLLWSTMDKGIFNFNIYWTLVHQVYLRYLLTVLLHSSFVISSQIYCSSIFPIIPKLTHRKDRIAPKS